MARRGKDMLPEVEGLVDLIFGLALSIGALILITTIPTDPSEVQADVLAFTYGFIILVFIWEEVTRQMLHFKVETTGMLRVTYVLLFLVALEPYLFNLITQHVASQIDELASSLYALDLGGLMIVLAFFSQKIMNGEGELPPEVRKAYHWKRQQFVFTATVFIVSIVPVFWTTEILGTRLRYLLWLLAPIIGLALNGTRRLRVVRSGEALPEDLGPQLRRAPAG